MTLEEYKKQVYKCLLNIGKTSKELAKRLIKEYEDDFPEYLEENW